nr:MAG TPA: hypothetical protein [Inoviridae sp.]
MRRLFFIISVVRHLIIFLGTLCDIKTISKTRLFHRLSSR